MSADRELLELAAKACGYDTSHPWNAERMKKRPPVIGLCIRGVHTNWNPLDDDGDALRLAVKLDMIVTVNRVDEYTDVCCGYSNADLVKIREPHGDIYAATRLAITRAAAEIGRAMP